MDSAIVGIMGSSFSSVKTTSSPPASQPRALLTQSSHQLVGPTLSTPRSQRYRQRSSASTLGFGQSSFIGLNSKGDSFNDDDAIDVAPAVQLAQPEPDPPIDPDGTISLSTRVEYSALPSGNTQDVFGLVTVHAADAPLEPKQGADEAMARQPMDIVCVIDVSGSMGGDKIMQVQGALRFIVDQADPKDRVSLVAFNSQASRVLRLRRMDAAGKDEAISETLRLTAGGGTSIAAGLDVGLSVMEQRRQRNKISAILLLTDGQDGSTRSQIPTLLSRAARTNCALYCFGFGADHDSALLSEVAEQAHTPFTFVEDTNQIAECFAGAVGGLSSIVAQNLQLSLRGCVSLKAVHTAFPVSRVSGTQVTVTFPDMFAGERRDILVELEVPAGGQAVLLETDARYIDVGTGSLMQTATVSMETCRVEEPQPELEPDLEVSAQRERIEVTRALENASAQSDLGNFQEAQRVIDVAEGAMRSSKHKTKMSSALVQELADARERMQSRSEWEGGGRAECRDATQMHRMQRSTNTCQSSRVAKSSKAMYCSTVQGAWIQRSKTGF